MKNRAILTASALALLAAAVLGYRFLPAPVEQAGDSDRELIGAFSAERYISDVTFLSSDELQGRASGSPELERAAEYIAEAFRKAGLMPAGDDGTYFQSFEVTTGAELGANNFFEIGETPLSIDDDFVPILFSDTADATAPLVFAGYGISAPELDYDDYDSIDVTNKIVVVLRHEPQEQDPESKFAGTEFTRHASFVNKAINARLHGAVGIIFITDPLHEDEEVGPATRRIENGDMRISAIHAKRDILLELFEGAGQDLSAIHSAIDQDLIPRSFEFADGAEAHMTTDIIRTRTNVRNVVGALEGSDPNLKDEWVVIGAHYDHLGLGDQSSLAPSQIGEVHHGADDNASGTAGVMELARLAANDERQWGRSVLFMTFAAEEIGLLGSSYFADNPTIPLENITAMINMDMIGRVTNNRLFVGGVGTSPNFEDMLEAANEVNGLAAHQASELDLDLSDANSAQGSALLDLDFSESGYGASDHTPFNTKDIPVLFFFSGLHTDYHKPSDTYEKINAEGALNVLRVVYGVAERIADAPEKLAYVEVERPQGAGRGGGGGGYGPYFGSVPDFRDDLEGVLFADIVNDSPAAKAGLMAGDIMVEFDGLPITGLNDYAYALRSKQPGDVVGVVVERNGENVAANVTLDVRR